MVACQLYRIILLTFIFIASLCPSSNAFLKQIIGATLLGDVRGVVASLKCTDFAGNLTSFTLFTRSRPENPVTLVPYNWNSLKKSKYDPNLPTKIIIHGFLDNTYVSEWILKMKSALLLEGNYNVIVVDWSCGNGFPYSEAVENAKITATRLGDLLLFLKVARGANPADFHIIGHSLGSQIAGLVGQRVKNLGRISALDPAGPLFYNVPAEGRLDPSDANFVDVIHTDGGHGMLEGLGLFHDVGHVDFYPNGGHTQPGCHSSPFDVLQKFGLQGAARYYLTCDHFRSIDFYIETIKQKRVKRRTGSYCQYVGVKCSDWETFAQGKCTQCTSADQCTVMGFYSDIYWSKKSNSGPGTNAFYMKTSDEEPYCVHQYGITMDLGQTTYHNLMQNKTHEDIFMEVKTTSGRPLRLRLGARNETNSPLGKPYTYLTTSKYPIGQVKEASMWLGSEEKPFSPIIISKSKVGFPVRKLEITPITMSRTNNLRSDTGIKEPEKTILCTLQDTVLAKNEWLALSLNNC